MKYRVVRLVVIGVALIAGFTPAAAAQTAAVEAVTQPDPPPPVDRNSKPYLLVLPVVYYTPETRLAYGVGGMFNFRIGKGTEQTRPTSLGFLLVHTLNKQTQVLLKPEIYLPGDWYLISGTLQYERMPQKFFGIGRDTPESAMEEYTPSTFGVQVSIRKRLPPHLFVGIQYEFDSTTIVGKVPGGVIDRGSVPGSQGGTISGVGATVSLDSRDNVLTPGRGQYLVASVDQYSSFLGSNFNFTSFKFDFRSYFPLGGGNVLALQAYVKARGGTVPFYQLPQLGGESLMRGYYHGRFRDGTMVTAQGELRVHVWKRIGVVGFAGLGEVCPTLGQCTVATVLPMMGAGLRIKLDSRGGTNFRIDYAWGKNSHGLYMTIQEAF